MTAGLLSVFCCCFGVGSAGGTVTTGGVDIVGAAVATGDVAFVDTCSGTGTTFLCTFASSAPVYAAPGIGIAGSNASTGSTASGDFLLIILRAGSVRVKVLRVVEDLRLTGSSILVAIAGMTGGEARLAGGGGDLLLKRSNSAL